MSRNRKVAKQKRTNHPKSNPALNPRKRKRADDVFRQRAKPTTDDLTERFNRRSPARVHQIPDLPKEEEQSAS